MLRVKGFGFRVLVLGWGGGGLVFRVKCSRFGVERTLIPKPVGW